MAAPNMISPTGVFGRTTYLSPTSTAETAILTNAASSNKLYKITSLYAANVHGSNTVDCSVRIYDAATGGTGYYLASTVAVPADATVVMIGKDAPIYLEENRRIAITASASGSLTVILAYEEV